MQQHQMQAEHLVKMFFEKNLHLSPTVLARSWWLFP
jgi:hypothetical protein